MRWRPETRAKWGAKFLDRVRPGWWRKVKVTKLDQAWPYFDNDCGCVLAQLYGSYSAGLLQAGIETPEQRTRWGFADLGPNYAPLTEAWRNEVRARRKAARA